ncbi:5'-nucleotidase C-terminal domain-containing protein [Oceanirhabdus sp. W0125-5]|uniref:5'-nucleotidase C-terminal domain-containing protein n=1 Tax=Oceanirhabdus sp. W0125-5 TaxID=2999116 RepID=UPI0022F34637|nr:5'-nucleotidase C-terminal domain-containing protein [Oceanirhabdus sp. W0125-5]WBW99154.1 5'-nucleotidase C-terminal domain-containing protein [Oceanirhabdus sp. W0125-5]
MWNSRLSKKYLSVLTMLFMLFSISSPVFADETSSTTTDDAKVILTLLGTSDLHGATNSWSYESKMDYGNVGLERVSTIYKIIKEENPNTLLFDIGDTIQGSIMTDDLYNNNADEKQPMIDIMSFIGYDAMALGNHEFNFGTALIKKFEKEASFPILSANTYYKEDGSHFVKPYVIKEVAGIKIGILGLTVPSIPRWDGPKVEDLKFEHMAQEAKKYTKILKEEEKVDIIVCLAHAGLETRHEKDNSDAAKFIPEEAPEISAMFLGHDHSQVNTVINGVPTAAPVAKYGQANEVARIDLTLEKVDGVWTVTGNEISHIELAKHDPDPAVVEYGKKYHETTLKFLENTIGTATADFHPASEVPGIPEAQIRDTALIDLINDVQLKITGAEVAAAALFKPNSNLRKGDLNFANVFDIYKYANKLVGVEVTGAELKKYMEWSASYYNTFKPGDLTISFNEKIRGYNYDMFAGVNYKVDVSKPAGKRIVDLTLNGKPVTDDQIIKLAINDYRYSGLKGKGMISNEPYFNSDPNTLRSYIKDYIEEKGTISPKTDNNWELIGYTWDENLRKIAIEAVISKTISIPKSKDGRTSNVAAVTVNDLKTAGLVPVDMTYIVKYGDTLGSISQIFKVSLDSIINANSFKNINLIFPGDKVIIPGKAHDDKFNTYIVKAGDTLGKIAEMYGIDYKKIADFNNIKNINLIIEGQKIIIPSN